MVYKPNYYCQIFKTFKDQHKYQPQKHSVRQTMHSRYSEIETWNQKKKKMEKNYMIQ